MQMTWWEKVMDFVMLCVLLGLVVVFLPALVPLAMLGGTVYGLGYLCVRVAQIVWHMRRDG